MLVAFLALPQPYEDRATGGWGLQQEWVDAEAAAEPTRLGAGALDRVPVASESLCSCIAQLATFDAPKGNTGEVHPCTPVYFFSQHLGQTVDGSPFDG